MPDNLGMPVAQHQPEGIPKRLNRRKDDGSVRQAGISPRAGEGDGDGAVGNGSTFVRLTPLIPSDMAKF